MRDFQQPGRSCTISSNGMVATSHPLAASEALDILKSGGNAMDAAISGAALLSICEPHMCGIGGDVFALWNVPGSNDVHGINGSGRAPDATNSEELRAQHGKIIGLQSPHAVTIPGAVGAFCYLSDNVGRLGLERVLAPAIRYAVEGVPIAPRVAFDWASDGKRIWVDNGNRYSFDGGPPRIGQLFRSEGLADVLTRISKGGQKAFYQGEVAQDMVDSLRAVGGVHTMDDFESNQPDLTTPISGTYGNAEVLEHAPNGQGATAILIMNILSHFDVAGMDPRGAERVHIEAEATRLAYDLRNEIIGDPDFSGRASEMLEPETAALLAGKIDIRKAGTWQTEQSGAPHKDTVFITVVDKDRMSVSLIYSIFHSFGAGIASDRFGILMQNRGCGFSLEKGHANEAAPGKRPLHTIIPGLVRRNGQIEMPFGVMGGQYQSTGHARLISNLEDFDMDIQSAIDAPRAFAIKGRLELEAGYSEEVRQDLASRGHNILARQTPLGGAQAIQIDRKNGVLVGGSDPRKDGCAIGY